VRLRILKHTLSGIRFSRPITGLRLCVEAPACVECLPGASRVSQPERDADRRIFTRRICRIYVTVKHLVTAAHERPSVSLPPNALRIFRVNRWKDLAENNVEIPKPACRGKSILPIEYE
jgi:hypothetical protein